MMAWLGLLLDSALIVIVGVGVVQAVRLIRQLKDLKKGRSEMETFVRDFNNAVIRAEAGIKALRTAARESGDDLEKLVEKAGLVRDELTFIVESADGVADRLSSAAAQAMRKEAEKVETPPKAERPTPEEKKVVSARKIERAQTSRAEKELMQALKKLG
ncbi:MAG: DUF6468 domain-containing protein [Alphaproteobacteria bacterium]|nr:DUF6468 domain-containing protein [Alphaproteobacteria bacterium]